ncbi:MAG: hypothetical protein AB7G80_01085 [Dongiaceae bacterium]
MPAYLITFDLNRTGQNYDGLKRAIESYGLCRKIATTTFVVISNKSSAAIVDHLLSYIDNNDEIFVGRLAGEAGWYGLGDNTTAWLQENLN